MKTLLFLACVFLGANALDMALIDELKKKVSEIGMECAQSENATPEDMEALRQQIIPATQSGKCLILCTIKKIGLMNDESALLMPQLEVFDKIKANDPEIYGKVVKIHEVCANNINSKPKGDQCDAAAALVACLKEEKKKLQVGDDVAV